MPLTAKLSADSLVLQTFLYGNSSHHHIEATTEDSNDDLELFLANAANSTAKAERLPQFAMSLFRKPELGDPWDQYRTGSSEDEDDEYEEEASPEPEDTNDQRPYDDLNTDIALLRNSLAQKEAEKQEKSYASSFPHLYAFVSYAFIVIYGNNETYRAVCPFKQNQSH